jgi:hypothetical protein
MAERTIVVCDVCGKPATEMVTIKTERGNFVKDLCAQHVTELTAGARKPRPGRPRKMGETAASAPRRRGRPRKTAASNGRKTRKAAGRKATRKAAGRKTSARKTSRRTSARKAQAPASS